MFSLAGRSKQQAFYQIIVKVNIVKAALVAKKFLNLKTISTYACLYFYKLSILFVCSKINRVFLLAFTFGKWDTNALLNNNSISLVPQIEMSTPNFLLSNGKNMPMVGLGTWRVSIIHRNY